MQAPPTPEPGTTLVQRYAPQIGLKVERLSKGFNVEASVQYAATPEEANRLIAETLAVALQLYPSAKDLEDRAKAEAEALKAAEAAKLTTIMKEN